MDYASQLSNARSAQTKRSRPDQVKNNAGGFVYEVTPLMQFRRFLILGSESGSYYAGSRDMTLDNVRVIDSMLAKGSGIEAVNEVVEVSQAGRAPKNDAAIFALAYLAVNGDEATKTAAYTAMPKVCRTGTHLFQWADAMKKLGSTLGSGGARRAIASWYNDKPNEKLALQVVKYKQRNGWSHRDVLRLGHVRPPARHSYDAKVRSDILTFAARPDGIDIPKGSAEELRLLYAARALQTATTERQVLKLIQDTKAPRELVPTQFLKSPAVWEALLEDMPVGAMVRNLGKMSAVGLLKPLSAAAKVVSDRLHNQEALVRSRLHPIQVLAALLTYQRGQGVRGSLTWTPVPTVQTALDDAFYLSFGSVKPSNKRTLIAVDVSGSMTWSEVNGVPGLTPFMAAGAMAMVAARTESEYFVTAFSHSLQAVDVTAQDRLDTVTRKLDAVSMGGTDCSAPMLYAKQQGLDVDAFYVYTDNETWAGRVKPDKALRDYRRSSGNQDAKLIVAGMTATNFTIADPRDGGMLDVVGFDTNTPQLMADFARGDI